MGVVLTVAGCGESADSLSADADQGQRGAVAADGGPDAAESAGQSAARWLVMPAVEQHGVVRSSAWLAPQLGPLLDKYSEVGPARVAREQAVVAQMAADISLHADRHQDLLSAWTIEELLAHAAASFAWPTRAAAG